MGRLSLSFLAAALRPAWLAAAIATILLAALRPAAAQTPSPLAEWQYSAGIQLERLFEPTIPTWEVELGAAGQYSPVADGTPIEPPPQLDANGNPIFEKGHDDDDDAEAKSDKAADGMGIIDAVQKKFLRKIPVGSDPEQFAISKDGKRIYISNEDVGAATVLDADTGKNLTFIPVTREPEGAGVRPDGKVFYITCETGGDVFAIDAETF